MKTLLIVSTVLFAILLGANATHTGNANPPSPKTAKQTHPKPGETQTKPGQTQPKPGTHQNGPHEHGVKSGPPKRPEPPHGVAKHDPNAQNGTHQNGGHQPNKGEKKEADKQHTHKGATGHVTEDKPKHKHTPPGSPNTTDKHKHEGPANVQHHDNKVAGQLAKLKTQGSIKLDTKPGQKPPSPKKGGKKSPPPSPGKQQPHQSGPPSPGKVGAGADHGVHTVHTPVSHVGSKVEESAGKANTNHGAHLEHHGTKVETPIANKPVAEHEVHTEHTPGSHVGSKVEESAGKGNTDHGAHHETKIETPIANKPVPEGSHIGSKVEELAGKTAHGAQELASKVSHGAQHLVHHDTKFESPIANKPVVEDVNVSAAAEDVSGVIPLNPGHSMVPDRDSSEQDAEEVDDVSGVPAERVERNYFGGAERALRDAEEEDGAGAPVSSAGYDDAEAGPGAPVPSARYDDGPLSRAQRYGGVDVDASEAMKDDVDEDDDDDEDDLEKKKPVVKEDY